MPSKKEDLPDTLKRSPAKAQRTYEKALDSAHEQYGDEAQGARDFRKHVSWYLTGYPVGGEMRRRMALTSSLAELDALLDELDPAAELPFAARRAKRGHTSGPRPVALPYGWIESADSEEVPEGAELLVSGG